LDHKLIRFSGHGLQRSRSHKESIFKITVLYLVTTVDFYLVLYCTCFWSITELCSWQHGHYECSMLSRSREQL